MLKNVDAGSSPVQPSIKVEDEYKGRIGKAAAAAREYHKQSILEVLDRCEKYSSSPWGKFTDELVKTFCEVHSNKPREGFNTMPSPPSLQITTKQKMHAEICELAKGNCVPFGGYVRDLISGDEPGDLDLFCDTNFGPLEKAAKLAGWSIRLIRPLRYNAKFAGNKYQFTHAGTSCNVDMVFAPKLNPDCADADVNSLYLDKNGAIRSFVPGVDVGRTIANIHAKKAILLLGCTEDRAEKLHNKGYTLLVEPSEKEEKNMNIDEAQNRSQSKPKGLIRRDLEKVAYRQSAKKISKGTRLMAMWAIQKAFSLTKDQMRTIKHMVEQPAGDAILSYCVGLGLVKIPGIPETEIIEMLAEHFRVHGLDIAADEGLDLLVAEVKETVVPFVSQVVGAMKAAKDGEYLSAVANLAEIAIPENVRIMYSEKSEAEEEEAEPQPVQVMEACCT